MFVEHNGHELAQLQDVTGIVRRNITDLQKLILNTKRANEDNAGSVEKVKAEVFRMRDIQINNID